MDRNRPDVRTSQPKATPGVEDAGAGEAAGGPYGAGGRDDRFDKNQPDDEPLVAGLPPGFTIGPNGITVPPNFTFGA